MLTCIRCRDAHHVFDGDYVWACDVCHDDECGCGLSAYDPFEEAM